MHNHGLLLLHLDALLAKLFLHLLDVVLGLLDLFVFASCDLLILLPLRFFLLELGPDIFDLFLHLSEAIRLGVAEHRVLLEGIQQFSTHFASLLWVLRFVIRHLRGSQLWLPIGLCVTNGRLASGGAWLLGSSRDLA